MPADISSAKVAFDLLPIFLSHGISAQPKTVVICRRTISQLPQGGALMANETQNKPDLEIVLLSRAMLCLDCEVISESRGDECPACKSHSLLSLVRVLGGSLRQDQSAKVFLTAA